MAWTAPMTFVANAALTAAQLNTHLRDNMFETEVAKITAADNYLVALGKNRIKQGRPVANRLDTDETTTSTQFTDLATVGPTVTMTSGTKLLIWNKCDCYNDSASSAQGMAFDIQGLLANGDEGTSIEAKDTWMCMTDGVPGSSGNSVMNAAWITVTAGANTTTAKYKVGSGTGHFRYRLIAVFPF